MADLIFVLITLAFFGLCVAYVRACDRLVRGGDGTPDTAPEPEQRRGRAMTTDNVIGLVLAVALAAYLVAALVFPERF